MPDTLEITPVRGDIVCELPVPGINPHTVAGRGQIGPHGYIPESNDYFEILTRMGRNPHNPQRGKNPFGGLQ